VFCRAAETLYFFAGKFGKIKKPFSHKTEHFVVDF
jgi:hypothetical protein